MHMPSIGKGEQWSRVVVASRDGTPGERERPTELTITASASPLRLWWAWYFVHVIFVDKKACTCDILVAVSSRVELNF